MADQRDLEWAGSMTGSSAGSGGSTSVVDGAGCALGGVGGVGCGVGWGGREGLKKPLRLCCDLVGSVEGLLDEDFWSLEGRDLVSSGAARFLSGLVE